MKLRSLRGGPFRAAGGAVLMSSAVLGLVLAGCGGGRPGGSGSPTVPPSPGSSSVLPSGVGSDPAQAERVLNAAGLGLPTGATDVTVNPVPKEPFSDRYLVTFTASAAALEELCTAAGLGGALFTDPALTAEDQELLGMSAVPSGAQGCAGSNPSDLASQRTIVFSGDPAKVWVGVWRMPSR